MARKASNPFVPLLIGGVIGSAAALLMSPASGRENRASLNRNINLILDRANEKKNLLIRDAQRIAKSAVRKAEDIYNKSSKFAEGKYVVSAESIELEIHSLRNALNAAVEAYRRNSRVRIPKEKSEMKNEIVVNEMITDYEDETLPKHEGMGRGSVFK